MKDEGLSDRINFSGRRKVAVHVVSISIGHCSTISSLPLQQDAHWTGWTLRVCSHYVAVFIVHTLPTSLQLRACAERGRDWYAGLLLETADGKLCRFTQEEAKLDGPRVRTRVACSAARARWFLRGLFKRCYSVQHPREGREKRTDTHVESSVRSFRVLLDSCGIDFSLPHGSLEGDFFDKLLAFRKILFLNGERWTALRFYTLEAT